MSLMSERSNIGRLARLQLTGGGQVVGNVLDLIAGSPLPKRVRIQFGLPELKGAVVFPSEYVFLGWADEEQD